MDYMMLGQSGIKVPRLCFGAMNIGGGVLWETDDKRAMEALEYAYDLGLNYIDTAPVYGIGHSERLLAGFLKGRRDKVILATKCCLQWRDTKGTLEYEREGHYVYRTHSPASLRQDLEDSLKRLGTDYIDVYIVHRESLDTPIADVMAALMDMKKEGKIRAIGLSNSKPDQLRDYLQYGPIDLVQEKFNLLVGGDKSAYFPVCEENGVTYQAYRALEMGLLAGVIGMDYEAAAGSAIASSAWYPADKRRKLWDVLDAAQPLCDKYETSLGNLMLAYILGCGSFINVLFGTRSKKSVERSCKALDIRLDAADIAHLEALAAKAQN
ncbi:MAG: aldo/keto reductase [Oscillospiraceae bacterium]|jgi:methylglyoxal reductase|nr:aldo/keto reductase [Oscillospiraceae bacterium]